jgi:hypothetical protein
MKKYIGRGLISVCLLAFAACATQPTTTTTTTTTERRQTSANLRDPNAQVNASPRNVSLSGSLKSP